MILRTKIEHKFQKKTQFITILLTKASDFCSMDAE